jgi:hypothetical protein
MKNILIAIICFFLLISFTVLPETGNNPARRKSSVSLSVKNSEAVYNDANIKKLNILTNHVASDYAILSVELDLDSPKEMQGEISVLINGKYPASSRLILREGTSHYSMEFILPDAGLMKGTLYMAQVTLKTGGRINDTVKRQFTVSDLSAAVR